jgi:hypothetical protein
MRSDKTDLTVRDLTVNQSPDWCAARSELPWIRVSGKSSSMMNRRSFTSFSCDTFAGIKVSPETRIRSADSSSSPCIFAKVCRSPPSYTWSGRLVKLMFEVGQCDPPVGTVYSGRLQVGFLTLFTVPQVPRTM